MSFTPFFAPARPFKELDLFELYSIRIQLQRHIAEHGYDLQNARRLADLNTELFLRGAHLFPESDD